MAKQSLGLDLRVPKGVELKKVPCTNGKYVAGSDGHIYCFSTAKVNSKKPQPFRVQESVGSTGYLFIGTIIDGKRRSGVVHTMVCLAFYGPKPSPAHEVRHLDGSRTNNSPQNIIWGTRGENQADKRRHGRMQEGTKHPLAKLNEEAVRIFRIAIPQGLWNSADAAKVFGVNPSVIKNAVARKTWKHVK